MGEELVLDAVADPVAAALDVEQGCVQAVIEQVNALVTRAQQSAARIRFVEDPALLADVGGVGALLRFKI